MNKLNSVIKKIRLLIAFFIIMLLLSGLTAFPVHTELKYFLSLNLVNNESMTGQWLHEVFNGVNTVRESYPFLFYGYDWLAFAHIMIAILFTGVYKNPVRNIWIMEWGMICCISIFPLAFICGPIRGIPFFHILIDCSFGVFGFILLWWCYTLIKKLQLLDTMYNQ